MTPKSISVPVTERALYYRVNRALDERGQKLRATRSNSSKQALGDYYLLDVKTNKVIDSRVNIEAFSRKIKALQPWEVIDRPKAKSKVQK